jgi:paraquat-inducible protein B
MSKKASPTLIGIFMLLGLLLGGTALVLFGAGKFFEKTSKIQLYFDKSADGLLVGSEVRFAGVRIGRVKSINVLIDSKDNRKIIPIIIELAAKDLKAVGSTSGEGIDLATAAGVRKAVAEGLRARMKQQSFVTGQLNIEFDIMPTAKVLVFEPAVKPEFPIVPTIGTELDALISGITDGLKKLDGIDFTGMMKELRDTLAIARTKIEAMQMKEINDNLVGITDNVRVLTGNAKLTSAIDSLDEALKSFDSLAKKADQGIPPLLEDMQKVMQQATEGLAKLQEASADISKVTNPRAPVLMHLQNVLEETERASRAIKELANDLKRNPSSLIRGSDTKP